jgi:hypothetical protein
VGLQPQRRDRLTSGDLPELAILREQWLRLAVVSRHCDATASG